MLLDDGDSKFANKLDECAEAYSSSQFAAATCTQPNIDKISFVAPKINVYDSLFKTGHHTTMQHKDHYLSYFIDNIPVSLVTFGLHLNHPFYNTSQRSGRYCTAMFSSNDTSVIEKYTHTFIDKHCRNKSLEFHSDIMRWMMRGINYYSANIDKITELVKDAIRDERPFYKGNLDLQAKRIAQEQLRCVLSTINPTGLVYTLNFTALLAFYKVAWNNPLRSLLSEMVSKLPKGEFSNWTDNITQDNNFTPTVWLENPHIIDKVGVVSLTDNAHPKIQLEQNLCYHQSYHKGVIDTLFFDPNHNSICEHNTTVKVEVEVPVSTFGQDQRHRTIKRGNPIITGNFYIPTIVKLLEDSTDFCNSLIMEFNRLYLKYGTDDLINFIPYGATVKYIKEADSRAYSHSVSKRLCWSAEKTISEMEVATLKAIFDDEYLFDAPCSIDKCHEGTRYCGRILGEGRRNRKLI